jgi:hypothetical protein
MRNKGQKVDRGDGTDDYEKGPDDASGVVWAFSEFFFFRGLLIPTDDYYIDYDYYDYE